MNKFSPTLDKGKLAAKWIEDSSNNRSEEALQDLLDAYHLLDTVVTKLLEGDK